MEQLNLLGVALGLAAMKAEESNAALPIPAPSTAKKSGARATPRSATQAAGIAAPLNPVAWWSTLQDQFTKIATAAATGSNATPAKAVKKSAKRRKKAR